MKMMCKCRPMVGYNGKLLTPDKFSAIIMGKLREFEYSHYDEQSEMHVWEEVED